MPLVLFMVIYIIQPNHEATSPLRLVIEQGPSTLSIHLFALIQMKLVHAFFLSIALLCSASLFAEPAHPMVGTTEKVVIQQFGRPTNSLATSAKTILIYPQGRITLSKGQVTDVSGHFEFIPAEPPAVENDTSTPLEAPAATPSEAPANVEQPIAPEKNIPEHFSWSVILENAQRRSEASGLPILALFTGPDWCPPCIQLEQEVLSRKGFQNYVRTNFIPLKVALYHRSPQSAASKAQYETLTTQYRVKGVPAFAILSTEGTLLSKPDLSKQYAGAQNREQHAIAAIQAADGSSARIQFYLKVALAVVVAIVLIRAIRK